MVEMYVTSLGSDHRKIGKLIWLEPTQMYHLTQKQIQMYHKIQIQLYHHLARINNKLEDLFGLSEARREKKQHQRGLGRGKKGIV